MSERKILDITPLDPEIELITDWLAGELTEAGVAAVERRLLDDDAFWMKAGPIVKLWNLPIKYEALLQHYASEPVAKPKLAVEAPVSEWARATAAAIVRGAGSEPVALVAPPPASTSGPVPSAASGVIPAQPERVPTRERMFRYWFSWAGETTPPGPGHYWARIWYSIVTMAGLAVGHDRRVNQPESPVDRSPALSTLWDRVEQGLALTGLAAVVLIFAFGFYSSYQERDDSSLIRRAVHVFTRAPLVAGTKLTTAPAQEVAMTLPSGTRTTVRGSSTLEWNAAGAVMLRGTATFEVPPGVPEQRVLTDYGDVRMAPGSYALGRDGSGKFVLVSVVAGLARIRADTADTTAAGEALIGPGEFGSVPSRGTAAKVEPRSAAEYPSFARQRAVLRSSATSASGATVERWRQYSWIRLARGSRLAWDVGNPAIVRLIGEMAMVLDPRDGATLVQTEFGDVVLRPGSHAIRTVTDSVYAPALLVSTRGAPPRMIAARRLTGTEQIVDRLGLAPATLRPRDYAAADYPALIPDSLAPRTPFGAAQGVRP